MATRSEPLEKKGEYYSIKEGSFRLPTSQDDPTAIKREYTNPKTKESGVAYERGFKALFGYITGVSFRENSLKDGTVLRSMNISLGENEDGIPQVISLPQDSRFTSDFLKKLPNIDLKKEVRIAPYDFEPKEGPRQVGLSITQQEDSEEFSKKIYDFFVEKVEDGSRTRYVASHGFPEATDEDKSDWPFYFKRVNKFLIKYATENILPKFEEIKKSQPIPTRSPAEESAAAEWDASEKNNEISPDDIPF